MKFIAGDFDGNGYNDLLYGGGSGVTFMQLNKLAENYLLQKQLLLDVIQIISVLLASSF